MSGEPLTLGLSGELGWQIWRLYLGFGAALGLIIGSFLNVVISRLPEDRSVVSPPSACPRCSTPIAPRDNIPVVSWVLLRGRCRSCAAPISSLYPTIELLTGVLGAALYIRLLPDPSALDLAHGAAFVVHLVFVAMLIAITFIDLRHYIIPDEMSVYAIPFAFAAMALLEWLGWEGAIGWRASALGALFGGGALIAIMGLYYLVRRRQGMGWGDPKMLGMIGAFLGPVPALPIVIFVAATAASAVGMALLVLRRGKGVGMQTALPFGPFLALGAVVYLLHGEALARRWLIDPALLWSLR